MPFKNFLQYFWVYSSANSSRALTHCRILLYSIIQKVLPPSVYCFWIVESMSFKFWAGFLKHFWNFILLKEVSKYHVSFFQLHQIFWIQKNRSKNWNFSQLFLWVIAQRPEAAHTLRCSPESALVYYKFLLHSWPVTLFTYMKEPRTFSNLQVSY